MLPKINRLTKKKDIDLVFKKGRSFKNDFLVFKTMKNHLKESRFCFIVSKKVSNKATVRNKVKRRLRSIILNNFKKNSPNSIKKPLDIIIIALFGIEKKEFSEVKSNIFKVFEKLNLI